MAVAGTDWCQPCWSIGGEVCGSVCHPVGGTEYSLGPLETFGRPQPLAGNQHLFNGTDS